MYKLWDLFLLTLRGVPSGAAYSRTAIINFVKLQGVAIYGFLWTGDSTNTPRKP